MTRSSFSREELIQRTTLTTEDLLQINQCRGNSNQFGFSYQLGFVRLMNRFPVQKPLEIQADLLLFIGNQLNADPIIIQQYEKRQPTISEHQSRIREYLKKKDLGEHETGLLKRFVFDEACRLEQIGGLTSQAKDFLREEGVLEPSSRVLERIIKEQRKLAQQHIFGKIIEAMPTGMVEKLDLLIDVQSGRMVSRPGELHPQPLAEPDRNLSVHPAPIKQTHLPFLVSNERIIPAVFLPSIPGKDMPGFCDL